MAFITFSPVTLYPFDTDNMFRWDYVYLHGAAEGIFNQPRVAPDLFTADRAMPKEETNVFCMVANEPALAVIRNRQGHPLAGRVALLKDTEGLLHALSPEDWA